MVSEQGTTGASEIGRGEQAWLRLVFGGPVSWWVPLARVVGVRVNVPDEVDDRLLAEAEAGAALAVQRFWPGLVATTVGVVAILTWLPVQRRMLGVFMHGLFHTVSDGMVYDGSPIWIATLVASTTVLAAGLIAGLGNALVFGGVPLWFLRRCTKAAAPAVGVAMAQLDDAFAEPQAGRYPRLAFAARQLLHPPKGWRRA